MDSGMFSALETESSRALSSVATIKSPRDLLGKIQPPTDYFVGIKGLRGVGKTTMLLQMAKNYKNPFYFSADAIYLRSSTIYEVVEHAREAGHDAFFVDEVHYNRDWTFSLKTLYDQGLRNLFFSGSSAIDLKKGADLSRRTVLHDLPPVSFREFLRIKKSIDFPPLTLQELSSNAKALLQKYLPAYKHFSEYLCWGGLLYDRQDFDMKLANSLSKLASVDLAYLRDINLNFENDIFRIFHLVASTPSFETNYSRIASSLGISKATAMRLVSDLEKAGGIYSTRPRGRGFALVRNEPKLFLPIPLTAFFCRQLSLPQNMGRMREEFFASHALPSCYLKTSRGEKTADFEAGGKIFEVGGVSKSAVQNPDYLVLDALDVSGNKIPLFLFGFLTRG